MTWWLALSWTGGDRVNCVADIDSLLEVVTPWVEEKQADTFKPLRPRLADIEGSCLDKGRIFGDTLVKSAVTPLLIAGASGRVQLVHTVHKILAVLDAAVEKDIDEEYGVIISQLASLLMGLLHAVSPKPIDHGSTSKHMNQLIEKASRKGFPWEETIVANLKQVPFYAKLLEAAKKRSDAESTLMPVVARVQEAANKAEDVSELHPLLEQLPALREQMRDGATNGLEETLLSASAKLISHILPDFDVPAVISEPIEQYGKALNVISACQDYTGALPVAEPLAAQLRQRVDAIHSARKAARVTTACKALESPMTSCTAEDLQELEQACMAAEGLRRSEHASLQDGSIADAVRDILDSAMKDAKHTESSAHALQVAKMLLPWLSEDLELARCLRDTVDIFDRWRKAVDDHAAFTQLADSATERLAKDANQHMICGLIAHLDALRTYMESTTHACLPVLMEHVTATAAALSCVIEDIKTISLSAVANEVREKVEEAWTTVRGEMDGDAWHGNEEFESIEDLLECAKGPTGILRKDCKQLKALAQDLDDVLQKEKDLATRFSVSQEPNPIALTALKMIRATEIEGFLLHSMKTQSDNPIKMRRLCVTAKGQCLSHDVEYFLHPQIRLWMNDNTRKRTEA